MIHNIENFLSIGYFLDETPNIDLSDFYGIDIKNCNSINEKFWIGENYEKKLEEISIHLSKKYIEKIFKNYKRLECGLWEGVDEGSSKWHNDWIDGDGFNSNILIYLDDNTTENGNSVEIRGLDFHHVLYPKSGQLLWLNQKPIFEHKATHTSGQRRLLSFEFLIEDLF